MNPVRHVLAGCGRYLLYELFEICIFCFGVIGCEPFLEQAKKSVFCKISWDMSYPGSEDAEANNLKGLSSDLDDHRQLNSPADQL